MLKDRVLQQQQPVRGQEYQSIGVPSLHPAWKQADFGPVKPLTYEQEQQAQQIALQSCRL